MEATAIVGLVANIAQFIQIGYELAVRAREVHDSVTGATAECAQLRLLVEDIRENTATVSKAAFSDQQATDAKTLQQLADACGCLANDLLTKLGKLQTRKNGWSRRFESVKVAGQAWWTKKEADALLNRLITLEGRLVRWWEQGENQRRHALVMCSLGRLEQRALRLEEKTTVPNLVGLEARLDKCLASLRAEAAKQRNEMMLEGLEAKTGANRAQGSREAQVQRHVGILKDAVHTAETYTEQISEARKRFRILESLTFQSMKTRRENIDNAHNETLGWVFDPSRTTFMKWLTEGTGIYWMNGLAGSGKSTMMKFVSDEPRTKAALAQWSGNRRAVIASYFFWISGTDMQKSQLGLFQTLLFNILRSDPGILDILFPHDRPREPWDVAELLSTFTKLKEITSSTTSFCFFIDGLDEYDGEEEKIIHVVKSLAASPNIKVCASSRPWPAFFAEWNTSIHSLAMQDFTRSDMAKFVSDRLASDMRFRSLSARDTRYHSLIPAITERAQGVWLWVQLVVRDLLRDMRDNEPFERLKARLEAYPIELDKFFERMLLRIDPAHRTETAQIFLLAIKAVSPMSILVLPLLERENGYQPSTKLDLSRASESQLHTVYRFWHPRLQNRCRDLMKLTREDSNPSWQRYQVDFLHRTVRDFLRDHYVDSLRMNTPASFDERVILCKLLLLGHAPLQRYNDPRGLVDRDERQIDQTQEWISELLAYVKQMDRGSSSEDSTSAVASILEDLDAVKGPSSLTHWVSETYGLEAGADILSITTAAGISRYTLSRVTADPRLLHQPQNPLLRYALDPCALRLGPAHTGSIAKHHILVRGDLVMAFLSLGADPNQGMGPRGEATPWSRFVFSCRESWHVWDEESRRAALEMMENMLRYGASTRIWRLSRWVSVFELLGPYLEPATIDHLRLSARKDTAGPLSWFFRYLRPG